jgi:predicted HAD superfamily Cof-like phosphohydrolase
MTTKNPTLEDFGFDSKELMIEVHRETMGKLIKAEAEVDNLRRDNERLRSQLDSTGYPLGEIDGLMRDNERLRANEERLGGLLDKYVNRNVELRAALKKAGVMLSQGFSKETVAEHIQAALANEQETIQVLGGYESLHTNPPEQIAADKKENEND